MFVKFAKIVLDVNSMEFGENEQCEDKHNQIIQILEKMQKRLADLSNPVKEMSSNMVNPSSTTLTPVSFFDNLDSMSRVEKLIDINKEDFKPLIVSKPAIYAPHMFDEIPEKVYMIQIPVKPLYAPKSVGFHVESIERVLAPVLGSELTNNDNETVYKLHEDERGKFQVLAESNKHICESELLEKGIGFDVSGQIDKSQNVAPRVNCFTISTPLVTYIRYLALLKGREIRACSPKYGLLVKLTIANAITCFNIKHEIENSALVVRCFSRMLEGNPVIGKPLSVKLHQCGRETRISAMIQGIAIKVVLGSEECTVSILVKAYSNFGQFEYATSFYKRVRVGIVTLWDAVIIVVSMSNKSGYGLMFCCWLKKNDVPPNDVIVNIRAGLLDEGRRYSVNAIRSPGPKINGSTVVIVWGNEMQYLPRMDSYVPGVQLEYEKGGWFKESMRVICISRLTRKPCHLKLVYLVKIQALEQAIGNLYSIRNQKLGHTVEKMQKSGTPIYNLSAVVRYLNVQSNLTEATKLGRKKCFKKAVERCQVDSLSSFVISYSGGKLLVIDVSYLDILWNARKAEIIVIGVYYLPNVVCKISEVVKNDFYFGC